MAVTCDRRIVILSVILWLRLSNWDKFQNTTFKPGTHYPCSRPVFMGREHGSCGQAPEFTVDVFNTREHGL